MSINWNTLRSWNGFQQSSFEELCCQLAGSETVPDGSRFFRKGAPDAGVECFWQLPNGDEWAWQAKFFRSVPNSTQWQEIDRSVETAIHKHPRLTEYTICLPIDRSDARLRNQKSFLMRWEEHVTKWQRKANKESMSVTFEYWGQSEIGSRLSDEKHRGRYWFWFNEDRFSNSWFLSRVKEAIANARDRYTPALNVDLPIRDNFDALGRTPKFFANFERMYSKLRIKLKKLRRATEPSSLQEKYDRVLEIGSELLRHIEPCLRPHKNYVEWTVTRPIPWDTIRCLAVNARESTGNCISEIYGLKEGREEKEKQDASPPRDNPDSQIYYLREFERAVTEIDRYCHTAECKLSNLPMLLLFGGAGQGKTHLLCELAKTETAQSRPRVIFHGEQFQDDEPWSQMIKLLGLNCSREQLLGALEAAAQANNCRVLIFIDALNEGQGNRLWFKFLPGMLTTLAQSRWLGFCVSVRSSYAEFIIPKSLDETRIVRVEHRGFGDLTADAVTKFFNHFGIEPSMPMLLPEFENPLFLKLFCQSLYNQGLTRVPPGLEGITAIFRFFIDSIDNKLSQLDLLDYDPRSQIALKAVELLSTEMAKHATDRLPLSEAQTLVNTLLPRDGNQKSLFHHLETEGVVTVVPDYWNREHGKWKEYVRFTYQRFSDHLITARLLNRHFDRNKPRNSFSKRRTLGKMVKDERACWMNRGILEALAIQIPEITKKELPDLAPHVASLHPMREAFVESIIWRDPASFSDATDRYINKEVLAYHDTAEDFWNALIAVATSPKHPLNADRLHKILSRIELPKRDAWWSIFLHAEWGRKRAIDRLIKWALADNDKSAIDDDVIRLAGIMLAWFFTTANRFLRDSATKAMVRLFENRIKVLCRVMEELSNVDDPYVSERLYAVGYGCALRTTKKEALVQLARKVYQWVFEAEEPPPHVLLRDYARGIIEIAVCRGADHGIDLKKVRPPYRSDWPSFEIPTLKGLKPLGESRDGMPNKEWARVSLYHSLMGDFSGDFSHYILGGFDQWSSERIDEPHKSTHEEMHDEFEKSLTGSQKDAWNSYLSVFRNIDWLTRIDPERRKQALAHEISEFDLERARAASEKHLLRSLRKNSKKYRLFREAVKEYVVNPNKYYRENRFDGQLARRWMMQKILNIGWTVERFGRFDRDVNSYTPYGGRTNKPERIGKKYQWIAYHELLARLSDNFKMRKDHWSVRNAEYRGPWDVGPRRDIDPSNLLFKTYRENWGPHTNAWWFPVRYSSWDEDHMESDWLKRNNNLPLPEEMIQITNHEDGSHWVTLDGHYLWEQPIPLGEERFELKRRELWYSLNTYVVKRTDSSKLLTWAKRQNWMGAWLPESHASDDIFLGEFFLSPAYKDQEDPYYNRNWTKDRDNKLPCEVLVANDGYSWSGGSYDCSIDETIGINLPCRFLVEAMHLEWRGIEGHWYDQAGQLAAFDPSVRPQGPSVLLFRKEPLIEFLHLRGLTLFWTILGEKRTIGGRMTSEDYMGHLEINGAYVLKNNVPHGTMRSRFVAPNPKGTNVQKTRR